MGKIADGIFGGKIIKYRWAQLFGQLIHFIISMYNSGREEI